MKTDNEWDIGEEDCVLVLKSTGKAAMFPPTKLDELIPDTEEYAVIPQNIVILTALANKLQDPEFVEELFSHFADMAAEEEDGEWSYEDEGLGVLH